MKKVLLTLIAAFTCMAMSAGTVTFVAGTDVDTENSSAGAWSLTKDGVTLSSSNGMGYNTSNYRFYKSSTLTISCSYAITEIAFTCTASGTSTYGPGCFTVDTGTYTYDGYYGTWTGSATEIVFTASTAQVRATQIVVTYDDSSASTTVATPKISPTAGTYYQPVEVSITTTTDSAAIYYSTDGTTYSAYTDAFTLNESATVYAYGVKDGLANSDTTSAAYTISLPTEVQNIAAALTYVESTGIVQFTNPVTVVYQNGYYTYVKDDTGVMLIYGSIEDYNSGDVIPAGFYGKMTSYYGLYEMTTTIATSTYSSDSFEAATTNNGTVSPTSYALASITSANMNEYVKIPSVTFDASAMTISDGTNSLTVYSRWSSVTTPESGTYDIEGFVSIYNSTVQIYPTSYTTSTSADYTITTAAEWNALAELMATDSLDLTDKVVKIANDIDFNGDTIKPLGYNFEPKFNGELDGQGFTISGYVAVADTAYYGALATMTGADAYIHDITVAGSISSDYSFAGGAIGFLYGGTAENIINTGTVTAAGTLSGGVIGGTGTGSVVSGCINRGTVSSSAVNAGGVIGRAWISTVKGCGNEGTVTSSAAQLGGVVGYFYGSTSGGCVVDSCYNKGTVVYTGTGTAPYASGIASMIYPGEYSNCWNEGTVYATSGVGYVSGVFGYWFGTSYGYHTILTGCYNTSDISGNTCVAGIICYGVNTNFPMIDMYDCYNTGNITATSGRAEGIANYYTPGGTYSGCYNTGTITGTSTYTAGLFGYYRGATAADTVATTFTGCYNTGDVTTSSYYSAGVVAYVYRYTTVDGCYNTGNISTSSYHSGGVIGYLTGNTTSKVSNCYNTGSVTSTYTSSYSRVGGIIGYSVAVDTVTNVFNTGAITGAHNYVGGIAGYCAAYVENAYNMGAVTGATYIGGIAGYKLATHGAIVNAYNTGTVTPLTDGTTTVGSVMSGTGLSLLSNCYYLESTALGTAYDTTSVSVTAAELAKLDLGDDWTAGDNYTYPRLTSVDVDAAKAYAVQVFPADGDSIGNITQGFYVGAIDGVTWTASPSYVEVSDNNATFTQVYTGTLTMTATAGDYAVDTQLTCNVTTVGISEVASDEAREVVAEKFYTVSGQQVAEPTEGARAIYIVVKTYDDGTTEAVKEVR